MDGPNNFEMRSPGSPRPATCCETAIKSLAMTSPNRCETWPEQVLCAPRSPWQKASVERVIGTIRREYLDHVIIFSETALYRQVNHSWRNITNPEHISRWPRTHRSRGKCNRRNSDGSWLSHKSAVSITGTNGAQPENSGGPPVRGRAARRHRISGFIAKIELLRPEDDLGGSDL